MDIRVITVIKDITDIMVMVDIRNYAESKTIEKERKGKRQVEK